MTLRLLSDLQIIHGAAKSKAANQAKCENRQELLLGKTSRYGLEYKPHLTRVPRADRSENCSWAVLRDLRWGSSATGVHDAW